MKIRFHAVVGVAACVAALVASAPAASAAPILTGDTVTATFSGNFNASASAVVGAGLEFTSVNLSPLNIAGEYIDIGATSITLNLLDGYFAPQTITISDLDFLVEPSYVVGFNLASNSIAWLNAGMISYTSNSITIDVGTGVAGGGRAEIELLTRSAAVPEPGMLALAGLALLSAYSVRRRS